MMFRRRRREEPRIDLTALVDVVFLLLIFFMISTTFIEAPGLGINLPRAASQRPPEAVPELKVGLTRDGRALVQGQILADADLGLVLTERLRENADTVFLLQADQEARHGRVVELMDLAKRLGYRKLAIATDPRGPRAKD